MNSSKRVLLDHSETIESVLKSLSASQAFGFGASCSERAWGVFKISAETFFSQSDVEHFRQGLDRVWLWLADLGEQPHDLGEVFDRVVLSSAEAVLEEDFFRSANILYGFAGCINQKEPNQVLYVADACLALIENHLYRSLGLPISHESNTRIDKEPLMLQEITRQLSDLQELHRDLSTSSFRKLWKKSGSESLLELESS